MWCHHIMQGVQEELKLHDGYAAVSSSSALLYKLCRPGKRLHSQMLGCGRFIQVPRHDCRTHESWQCPAPCHQPMLSCLFCLQEWGVDLSQHQQPNPATKAYVDWVHAIAQDPQQVRCC